MLSYFYNLVFRSARAGAAALFNALMDPPLIENKKKAVPKKIRDAVWIEYTGVTFAGKCYACGVAIDYTTGWHCSHVVAESKGGNISVENLRPCCRHCNLSMGNQNLYVYIDRKGLTGPGKKNVIKYFLAHPSEIGDVRTNNYGR